MTNARLRSRATRREKHVLPPDDAAIQGTHKNGHAPAGMVEPEARGSGHGCRERSGHSEGEQIIRLGPIEIVRLWSEVLNKITKSECVLEGFPDMEPRDFVFMFMNANHCLDDAIVNRIEFKYL